MAYGNVRKSDTRLLLFDQLCGRRVAVIPFGDRISVVDDWHHGAYHYDGPEELPTTSCGSVPFAEAVVVDRGADAFPVFGGFFRRVHAERWKLGIPEWPLSSKLSLIRFQSLRNAYKAHNGAWRHCYLTMIGFRDSFIRFSSRM